MNETNTSIKQEDEIYCPECSKPIKRNSVICPNCGVQTKELKIETKSEVQITPKNKGVAVVLAIFFGVIAFLYTFKKDATKFWLCIVFTLLAEFSIGSMFSVKWAFIGGVAFWIYAIINVAKRPLIFYENYPNT